MAARHRELASCHVGDKRGSPEKKKFRKRASIRIPCNGCNTSIGARGHAESTPKMTANDATKTTKRRNVPETSNFFFPLPILFFFFHFPCLPNLRCLRNSFYLLFYFSLILSQSCSPVFQLSYLCIQCRFFLRVSPRAAKD